MSKYHIHGGPHWGPQDVFEALYRNGRGLVSYSRTEQLKKLSKLNTRIVLDNGAFSTWRSNKENKDFDWDKHWTGFYLWIMEWYYRIDWFLIPDVIEGTEEENDYLVSRVPSSLKDKAVPVWHSDESLDRLERLSREFPLIAIGLCGPHRVPNSKVAQARLTEVFTFLYKEKKIPVKVHGLRMLAPKIIGNYPFDSCDSSTVAVNVPKTEKSFPAVKGKLARTAVLRASVEKVIPPTIEEWVNNN